MAANYTRKTYDGRVVDDAAGLLLLWSGGGCVGVEGVEDRAEVDVFTVDGEMS